MPVPLDDRGSYPYPLRTDKYRLMDACFCYVHKTEVDHIKEHPNS